MRRVELLVIGGGPAGAALAALTSEAGCRTLVVERTRFPRDKVCGEFLSAEGARVLDRLGLIERLVADGARRLDSCRITERHGARLDVPLSSIGPAGGAGLGLSRSHMDHLLLETAAERGAEVLQGWEATAPLEEGGRVTGVRLRRVGRDTTEEVRARLVIAADGRRSLLARTLHPARCDPRRSAPHSWFGLKTHLSGGVGARDDRVELHLFDGGYAGLAPIEGERLNLCLLVTVRALRASDGSPDRLLASRVRANPGLAQAIAGTERASGWKSVGPLRFGTRRPAAAGALFVGDAAGTLDPFCGQGMTHALMGAEMAFPFALRAVARGGLEQELARGYTRSWKRLFAPMSRRTRVLGQLFGRPRLARRVLLLLGGAGGSFLPRLVRATRTGIVHG